MRNILVFAALVMVGGGYLAKYADRTVTHPSSNVASVQHAAAAPKSGTASRSLTLSSDRNGHFATEAEVDGRRLNFIVDTGASLVTLRESDAATIGIRPTPGDYTESVATANGHIKAARARLNRLEVGDITIYDVSALVLPDEALGQNLLGVSFLSRLRRYEYANGRMILEQ
ncbi:MAG TPA: TIGR02281 family clan AA aspartic protease [Pseudolabrys sp.]|nr:TIGR02281 family clan AA aspartic protease [Pseudolabrys sp.]